MARLVIFAKGNLDLRDSLYSLRLGGKIVWNGLNEILQERFPGTIVRIRHETLTRTDALLATSGRIPSELAASSLALGAYSPASQFSQAVFETRADAYVLSVQPDILNSLLRHRVEDYLFYPYNREQWALAERGWLRQKFFEVAPLDVESSMHNFERVIERIRAFHEVPILIYNMSAVVPGEWVHAYDGLDETLSTRIRRFNLGLVELSRRTAISVIDVDSIFARAGVDRLKIDALHFTPEGCRLIAEETVRILEDLGILTETHSCG
jgi:hypothetical protein